MGSAVKYRPSPIGIARYAWVNKPDTKYNAEGLYHVDEVLDLVNDIPGLTTAEENRKYKAEIDAEVDAAFDREAKKLTEKARTLKAAEVLLQGWTKYYPYIEEKDEENGNPTGRIIFMFKQNAKIPQPDGSKKVFKLGIRDSANKAIDTPVYGGATIRVLFKPRDVKIQGTKQLGSRLDFSMVQLIKAAKSSGGGFDEVDGGYVGEEDNGNSSGPGEAPKPGADY
jgi:hypothetical protein